MTVCFEQFYLLMTSVILYCSESLRKSFSNIIITSGTNTEPCVTLIVQQDVTEFISSNTTYYLLDRILHGLLKHISPVFVKVLLTSINTTNVLLIEFNLF